jgi:VIT1/CCC1 family predicted Fe2+/Mn2+ transporter
MRLEIICLSDHSGLSRSSGMSREETFRTRLVQVDRPARNGVRDPLQHWMRRVIRKAYYITSSRESDNTALPISKTTSKEKIGRVRRYQTVAWVADTLSRFLFGLVASASLTVPMVFLMRQASSRSSKVATVVVCVVVFSLFVALISRAGPQEMMAASVAYAAVLVVFVSTSEKGGDAC